MVAVEGCRGEYGGGSLGRSHRRWEDRQRARLARGRAPPAASTPLTPAPGHASSLFAPPSSTPALTGSAFALPYRTLYAVVTMDTVAIYDMQQAGPVCLLTKQVYGFDVVPGQSLMRRLLLTLVTFDEILPTDHTQQPASGADFAGGPLEPLTPAASVNGDRERDAVISADFHRRFSPLGVRESPQLFASIKKHPPLLFCIRVVLEMIFEARQLRLKTRR
ncbi:hypothetical protein B0H16DRAFT_1480480 [Mycena metata]|uniref:Uncharacterized protein n=1 Tax=Mycena metata TaxID=1033252 RepID=A0AAD7MD56_9AGAR|nr:hypothetical protein B0H16DRAFT_1480480 [Mycena metata]